jgi:hypothetical protein
MISIEKTLVDQKPGWRQMLNFCEKSSELGYSPRVRQQYFNSKLTTLGTGDEL